MKQKTNGQRSCPRSGDISALELCDSSFHIAPVAPMSPPFLQMLFSRRFRFVFLVSLLSNIGKDKGFDSIKSRLMRLGIKYVSITEINNESPWNAVAAYDFTSDQVRENHFVGTSDLS